MADTSRKYDLVVYGATGFTGKYVSQHVTTDLPTDVKWAIAGRSHDKLQNLISDLRTFNADRKEPEIEVCSLDKTQLNKLAASTKVIINTIGPYSRFGEPVIEACINNGTHYFDVTGESPWTLDMIKKYDSQAKAKKTIIIPQIGVDSAPADLLSWSLATHIRQTLNAGTRDVVFSLYKMKAAPSGGTLGTVMTLFDVYSLQQIGEASKPWVHSPIGPPASVNSDPSPSIMERILGVRVVRDLGTLTTNIQGAVDRTQVHRTWGLLEGGKYYGDKFRFQPYMNARNLLTGALIHFAIIFGAVALMISPIRTLLKKFIYQPGEGPSKEESKHDFLEYRAIATADTTDPDVPKRTFGRFAFEGGLYHLTGIFASEAAITLLRDETLAKKIGGGFLTPATLGGAYIERLQKAGVKVEVRTMP